MQKFHRRIPIGDDRERLVCSTCGFVNYENPRIVVGAVVALGDKVLLCRRAIPPRRGYWTLPAGYLEAGETLEEGARREAEEEASARIVLNGILGIFDLSRLSEVVIIFRASFAEARARTLYAAGAESLEVAMFAWDEILWDEIAFPSTTWALDAWKGATLGRLARNPACDPRGEQILRQTDVRSQEGDAGECRNDGRNQPSER